MGNYALTTGDIIDKTLKVMNDFQGAGLDGFRWTRDEVLYAVKRVYLGLSRDTRTTMGTTQIVFVEDQVVYQLPDDCIYPTRIALKNGSAYIIFPKNIQEEVDMVGNLHYTGGLPNYFYREALDQNQIGVIPIPSLPAEGMSLDITYARTPASIDDELSYPDTGIPEFLQKDLKYGSAALLMSMKTEPILVYKSRIFQSRWNSRINLVKRMQGSPAEREGMVPV